MVVGIACGQTSSMAVVNNGEVSIAVLIHSVSVTLSYEIEVWAWNKCWYKVLKLQMVKCAVFM